MQSSSLLCSSNSFSTSPTNLPIFQRFAPPILPCSARSSTVSSTAQSLPTQSQNYRPVLPILRTTAAAEVFITSKGEEDFVVVGYISSIHGLQGELRVKPDTDFPDLRLSEPGKRWLRQLSLGKEEIQEVELVEGRGHLGQKNWIVRFDGIDTVDQAKQLVGSSILVKEEDRPLLEEGEFYSRDLVGMRVILQETGEQVGTVVNVFDSGGNDLLQVMLDQSIETQEGNVKPKSAPLVWVPFVEAIVPIVDMDKREMQITPPKGLLELNLRDDDRSKKERREIEWKEMKKVQRSIIAAKKKLIELGQKHVFHGLRYGEKTQRSLLADEIVGLNCKLFQHALQNIETPSKRWNLPEFMREKSAKHPKNILKVSKKNIILDESENKLDSNFKLQEKGLHLLSKGKVAIVLVVSNNKPQDMSCDLESLLSDNQKFIKLEDRSSVPLIVVCPSYEFLNLETIFLENEYFSFDSEKVWFLKEEVLPIISNSHEEHNKHKILMKSAWEMLKSPVGSGGVISLLSSHDFLEKLSKIGVDYIEICSTDQEHIPQRATILGFLDFREADVGIQISKNTKYEETFDVIFSLKSIKKVSENPNKVQFIARPKLSSYGELVDKEWVNVTPTSPNSYELLCSIYSFLNNFSSSKVCVMEIID